MREIKFRYVYQHDVTGRTATHINALEMLDQNIVVTCAGRTLVAREQYTGLKDKSGTEIYEGDILAGTYGEQGADARHDWYGVISFRDGGFWCDNPCHPFYLSEIDGLSDVRWVVENNLHLKCWYYSLENIRIVGNIHENPELLEPPQ